MPDKPLPVPSPTPAQRQAEVTMRGIAAQTARMQAMVPAFGTIVVPSEHLIPPAQQEQYQLALRELESYKVWGTEDQYDLAKAIQDRANPEHLNLLFGEDTVKQAEAQVQASAQAQIQLADVKATYKGLTEKQKKPTPIGGIKVPMLHGITFEPPTPGFDKILALGARAIEFPKAPGFYATSTRKKVKGETIQTSDPLGGSPVPFSGMTMPYKTVSFTKEDTIITTTVYARLEDGSIIQVESTTERKEGRNPIWVSERHTGTRIPVSHATYEKSYAGPFFGETHEQKVARAKSTSVVQISELKAPKPVAGAEAEEYGSYRYTLAEGGGYIVEGAKGEKFLYKGGERSSLDPVEAFAQQATKQGRVVIGGYGDTLVALSPAQLKQYADAGGEKQFEMAEKFGIIPEGGEYVPADITMGMVSPEVQARIREVAGTKEVWGFLTAEQTKERGKFEDELRQSSPDLYKIYKEQGIEAYNSEVGNRQREWENTLEKENPELYKIYKEEGEDAYLGEAQKINAEYEEFQRKLESGEIKELPDGNYIAKVDFDKQPRGTRQILGESGFEGIPDYFVPQYFDEKGWDYTKPSDKPVGYEYIGYGEMEIPVYSQEYQQYNERVAEAYRAYTDKFGSEGLMLRGGAEALGFIVPAAKAISPEYTVKDVSAVEWGLSAVNVALIGLVFAPGAILATLSGKVIVTGLTTTGAGLISYETKKHWAELSPAQRAIGIGGAVLYSVPLMVTVARGVRITSAKPIPTVAGEVPIWKGLSIAQRPIIGRSGGKWVIGAREITIPEARLILDGYHPEMMLEAKVFVSPRALSKAGFSKVQIDFLVDSLKTRNLFAGRKSPFVSQEVLLEPTKYIDADEMAVLLRQVAKYNKKIKHVDMLYGGTTIKAQLAPELRNWRQLHDLDMHTIFSLQEARVFVNETLALLKKLPGKRQYRISPRSPIRIEKMVDGKWEHINDLKSEFIDPKLQTSEIASSKLDATGEYSYGRMVAEPAITIEYPGVGKFDIMSLSESGVRKADTILRVRQTPEGTAFRPPERGIARPGVPKDAADYYAILKTFEEAKVLQAGIADEWLESWARAMGYTKAELVRVLPKLRKAAVEVAAQTPSNLTGYRFTPASKTTVSLGASPTMRIHIPSSLGASMSGSLAWRISRPVSIYNLSPRIKPSAVVALSGVMSRAGPSPRLSELVSAKVSPRLSKASVSPKPSLSPSPSLAPSVSPSLSAMVSPKISPKVSAKPSLAPSPAIFPPLEPVTEPRPKPKPSKPPPRLKERVSADRPEVVEPGTLEFRMGAKWVVIPPPYEQEDIYYLDEPLPGTYKFATGKGSAYKTVQILGLPSGQAFTDEAIDVDIGWARVFVPAGKEPTISFSGGKKAAEKRWAEEEAIAQKQTLEGTREYGRGDIIIAEEQLLRPEERLLPNQAVYYREQGLDAEQIRELGRQRLLSVGRAEARIIAEAVREGEPIGPGIALEKRKAIGLEKAEEAREKGEREVASPQALLVAGETLEGTREYGRGDIVSSGERLLPGVSPSIGGDSGKQAYDLPLYAPDQEKKRAKEEGEEEELFGKEIDLGEINLGALELGGVGTGKSEKGSPKKTEIHKEPESSESREVAEREAEIPPEYREEKLSARAIGELVEGNGGEKAEEEEMLTRSGERDDLRENAEVADLSVRHSIGMPSLREASQNALGEAEVAIRRRRNLKRRRRTVNTGPDLPERRYLGRILRPAELGVNL